MTNESNNNENVGCCQDGLDQSHPSQTGVSLEGSHQGSNGSSGSSEHLSSSTPSACSTFESPTSSPLYRSPRVCLSESTEGYSLEVSMPGVSKDGVALSFEGGVLTILGKRVTPCVGSRLYGEIPWANYRREVELDMGIDQDKISASISQGILRVQLPKAEEAKPRKIEVTG